MEYRTGKNDQINAYHKMKRIAPAYLVSIQKRWVAVQIEAAAILQPQAKQRYVEDCKMGRMPIWAARCRF
jgi:hypothetical protein